MSRLLSRIGLLLGVGVLAVAALPRAGWAQAGTVLSFQKINSITLNPLGVRIDDADEFGDATAWLGDLDGAGPSVAAVAVSAIGDDDGGNHIGAVYILFLNAAGTVTSYNKISATQGGFSGVLESYDEFGSSLAWLGDLDGAGPSVGALAVGAIGDDDGGLDRGAVYILFLNSAGSVLTTKKVVTTQVGLPIEVLADLLEFGGAVAGLGDLDGAGPSVCAMAVGAIGDDDGGINVGATFIVFLNNTGGVVSYAKISKTAGNFTAALDDNDNFAEDVAALGDLDGAGPGVRTIAVTAVDDDDGGTDSGACYLIHLTAAGRVSSWSKISRTAGNFNGPVVDTDNFGTAVVGLGDLDGAGPSTTAIAVAAGSDDGPGFNRGAIYVLFLNAAGSVLSYQEISSTAGGAISGQLEDDDEFGSALAALGDIDGAGGGAQTLLSGVGYDDDGGLQRGAAYLLSLSGSATAHAPVVTAPATASVAENALLTVNVTASDSDGDAITSLTATGLPAGATFTANASKTSGTLSWTPTFSQSGSYTVTFTASNALSGSASTQITVTNVDRAPAVTAPATASGPENALLTVNVTATDADGQSITSLTATNLPSGATFTANGSKTSGTLSWTPTFSQSGNYTVTFTASNALSGSASTQITVTNVDRAPVVTAPATASGPENAPLSVNVSATDADGQAITSLTATNLPAGATFTPNGGNTSGTLNWTPTFSQSGSYTVTFTASNALSGSSNTAITVTNVDRAPVVTAPATASGPENAPLSVNVTAADADGQAITSLTATNLPAGATFTPGAGNTSGTLDWTPTFSQSGGYTVTFTATNALSGSASTQVTVGDVDRAPVVTAPPTASGPEDAPLSVNVSAADADGQAITSLIATDLPEGATFTPDAGNASGTLSWTPTFSQSGSYTVTFTASNTLSGSASTQVTVGDVDRAPVVTAPPTASGPENALLSVSVTAADADGQAITSLTAADLPEGATFTPDAGNASGTLSWTPTLTQAGDYIVTFTAANTLSGSSSTQITIGNADRAPVVTAWATAFTVPGASLAVTATVSDPDDEGIASISATNLPPGATFTPGLNNYSGRLDWTPELGQEGTYIVTFTASNALSGSTTTEITVGTASTGVGPSEPALLRPVLSPSPVRSRGTLSFRARQAGRIDADLLDLSGRRVRSLMSASDAAAGVYHVPLDGLGDRGERLPPGVYLYRIVTNGNLWTGRVVLMR